MIRDENESLDEEQKKRVLEKAAERSIDCGSCGSKDFEVGEALYLGFLFLNEENDAYMVALTCKEPDCANPRPGIRLRDSDFLDD